MTTVNTSDRKRFLRPSVAAVLLLPGLIVVPAMGQWEQTFKLTDENGAQGDYFGLAVAVSGNVAIVGAPWDNDMGYGSGSAFLFDVGTGQRRFQLNAEDPVQFERFGQSVGISGDIAMIGVYPGDNPGSGPGWAYLFDVSTGSQLHKLVADDGMDVDWLGASVGISGDIAIAGAPWDDDAGHSSGSAYLFDVTSGQQLFKLVAHDAEPHDQFGIAVATDGDVAIVGATGADDAGYASGAAYSFDVATGQQLYKLVADDAEGMDQLGCSVDIDGSRVIVGACGDDDKGSAYLFDVATGQQLLKLTADDGAPGDNFGESVAITSDVAIVGASGDDDGGSFSGSAYVFDLNTGQQRQKLIAADAAEDDRFGYSLAVDGSVTIVGAWGDDDAGSNSGSAYVFRDWSYCPADVNFDNVVNEADIMALFPAWGECDGCREDVNRDGRVDIDDLFAVLAAWGPCP